MAALGFDLRLVVAYIINFMILLFALRAFAYKPVLDILEKRKKAIAEGLSAADEAKANAERERAKFQEDLEAARRSSQEEASKIAKATEDMREQILAAARQEAEEIKAKARAEIEAEKQAVQAEMQRQLAGLTVDLTRKMVGETVDEKKQHELIGQFLSEMGD